MNARSPRTSGSGEIRQQPFALGEGRIPLVETEEFSRLIAECQVDERLVRELLSLVWDKYYGRSDTTQSLREAVEGLLRKAALEKEGGKV